MKINISTSVLKEVQIFNVIISDNKHKQFLIISTAALSLLL